MIEELDLNMKRKAAEAENKPEKKLRWDVPKTASLISFYQEHPELWNPRVPEYSNDKLRLKAVETWLLENQLEPEKELINEVKLKLHGLRTSYGHELKMEATKKIDGHPYMSKWQWYRQLSFLKEAMCFRSRSGSMSSTANSRRITRRRGRRGQQIVDDLDHNHNDNFYHNDHDGTDVKIVALDNGGPSHGYGSMIEAEYEPLPPPPQAHQHPHTHHQHPGLVHMAVGHIEEAHQHHHHISSGGGSGSSAEHDHIQNQDPHVPVVTYRSRGDPLQAPPSATSSTITRNDSASNLNLMCLATSATAPAKQEQTSSGEETSRAIIPTFCNCKCKSTPQTTGERLGRLVEETFSNLHPEYHDMARWEIQQTLGKYLQKPIP